MQNVFSKPSMEGVIRLSLSIFFFFLYQLLLLAGVCAVRIDFVGPRELIAMKGVVHGHPQKQSFKP